MINSPINFLDATSNITHLEQELLKDGKVIPLPFSELGKYSQQQLSFFCYKYAIYQLPTTELIDFLKTELQGSSIEIGAGNGCIGRAIGIRMTDNHLQDMPMIKLHYQMLNQPTIKYGSDVEKVGASKAVEKYKPETVVGCWITTADKQRAQTVADFHGIDDTKLFNAGVKKYIHVGNEGTHLEKLKLFNQTVKQYKFPWLISRSLGREQNVIYIFGA